MPAANSYMKAAANAFSVLTKQAADQAAARDAAEKEKLSANGVGTKGKRKNKGTKLDLGLLLAPNANVASDAHHGHEDNGAFNPNAIRILYRFWCNYSGYVRFYTHVNWENTTQKSGSTKRICKCCNKKGQNTNVPYTRLTTSCYDKDRSKDHKNYKDGIRSRMLHENGRMIPGVANENGFSVADCKRCGSSLVTGEFAFRNSENAFVAGPNGITQIGGDGSGAGAVIDYIVAKALGVFCEYDNTLHPTQGAADRHFNMLLKKKGCTQCSHCEEIVKMSKISEHVTYNCPFINAKREEKRLAAQKEREAAKAAKAKAVRPDQFTTVTNKRRPKTEKPKAMTKTCGTCGEKFQSTYAGKATPCCRDCFKDKGKGPAKK